MTRLQELSLLLWTSRLSLLAAAVPGLVPDLVSPPPNAGSFFCCLFLDRGRFGGRRRALYCCYSTAAVE